MTWDTSPIIILTVCEHDKPVRKYIKEPWPKRVAICRELLDTAGPCITRTSGAADRAETIHISFDNGDAEYRAVGGDAYSWIGELIYGTFEPAPAEPADAAA